MSLLPFHVLVFSVPFHHPLELLGDLPPILLDVVITHFDSEDFFILLISIQMDGNSPDIRSPLIFVSLLMSSSITANILTMSSCFLSFVGSSHTPLVCSHLVFFCFGVCLHNKLNLFIFRFTQTRRLCFYLIFEIFIF